MLILSLTSWTGISFFSPQLSGSQSFTPGLESSNHKTGFPVSLAGIVESRLWDLLASIIVWTNITHIYICICLYIYPLLILLLWRTLTTNTTPRNWNYPVILHIYSCLVLISVLLCTTDSYMECHILKTASVQVNTE